MRLSFFDHDSLTPAAIQKEQKKLVQYQSYVHDVLVNHNGAVPEHALGHAVHPIVHQTLDAVRNRYKAVKHLILVGIGGSSLGVEAIHEALGEHGVTLSVLDTLSAHDIQTLTQSLSGIKKVEQLVVCVISKSGTTTETTINASVLLDGLKARWGDAVYAQTLFIGNPNTPFMQLGKRLKVATYPMPESIGGRYSVATEVGLIPLTILGHDVDAFIEGFAEASATEFENLSAESAARLSLYIQKGFQHYNFFAFEKRLATLGAWYRQLFAESIGKAVDQSNKPFQKGMVPTISTPVELHSIGQLYMSGFKGVYTDFVTFDDEATDFDIPKQGLAKHYARFSLQDVTAALYGGVVGAYNEKKLPYRTTIFDDNLPYSLGLFMSLRMREVMYTAKLLNLDAFNQPSVELYKKKTKDILGV